MKTPRELLLARHRHAEPRLDAARQRALATLAVHRPAAASPGFFHSLSALARYLRWHLAGMSAVWLAAGWLGSLDHVTPPPVPQASGNSSAPNQLITALRENRRQVAELLGASPLEPGAAKVPAALPPPRRTGQLERRPHVAARLWSAPRSGAFDRTTIASASNSQKQRARSKAGLRPTLHNAGAT